ncbi:MAG: pilus assembly protein N-terminal domain-containing protein [Planctomycetaceae bacterium]|nr:pilus assembly protein N-terminal domain-containing protein [Planctomycetaceae bacterium]
MFTLTARSRSRTWQRWIAGVVIGALPLAASAQQGSTLQLGPVAPPAASAAKPDSAAPPAPPSSEQDRMARIALLMQNRGADIQPTEENKAKERNLIAEMIDPELKLEVRPNRSKLLRTKKPVSRVSVSDPVYAEVTQLTPTEFEIIGLRHGETTLTLWFGDPAEQQELLRYLVIVSPDAGLWDDLTRSYQELEQRINEMFPDSSIQLIPVADKVILRGQARDAEDASRILQIVRGQTNSGNNSGTNNTGGGGGAAGGGYGVAGNADLGGFDNGIPGGANRSGRVINMLKVPHEHQILLRVRVAELSRTAMRELGANFNMNTPGLIANSNLGTGANLTAIISGGDLSLFLRAVASNGHSKVLAEPNLVTLNGQTASFIAGGQFAVPTAVGVNGIGAATTTFQGFGTQLLFTPTLVDKDLIRLQVTPTFSTLNQQNAVNGIPGLTTRSAQTTVDIRVGQWLAIAGLLQDEQQGSSTRVPILGDVPVLNVLFSRKSVQRNETELLVLVSPELVHPLEQEQLPHLLPGMEVTEPSPADFYMLGAIEGMPEQHHRSTVYHAMRTEAQRERIRAAKSDAGYQRCESFYVTGAHGFSE